MTSPAIAASIPALPASVTRPERASIDPNRASATVWIAVIAAMIGSFMAILNIQITNASLLNIEGGIGTGVDNGSWISTSYLIGEIVVIPLTDFLSRVFSFRRYMLASAALFAVFSVACAFTHDLPSMIAMRGLQGFAGGVLIPMAFTLILTKLQTQGLFRGQLIKLYIIAYLVYRFATEFIRPEPKWWLELSIYQWAALLFAPVFALLWVRDRQVLEVTNGLTSR